jgi:signal recognition particle receptor subunit beta
VVDQAVQSSVFGAGGTMVLINKAINEITVKLVYYGPGLCGKTTNLEKIYQNPKMSNKGKMISMATETDRTLFFDFMPMELGTIGGQKVRVQLYTVPGQVFYDATRKLVLRGADGVIFVADSQASMRESNIDSLENLKTNLRINRIDPNKIPIVYQANKRDLPGVSPVDEMRIYLNTGNAPIVEAAAISGVGVTQTLRSAIGLMLDNIKGNVDITLYEGPELRKPDMKAGSGVTQGSAGVPKVGVAGKSVPVAAPPAPAAPRPVAPPPPAAPPAPVTPAASPFQVPDASAFAEIDDELPEVAPVVDEVDPFADAATAVAEVEESPFGDVTPVAVAGGDADESPFDAAVVEHVAPVEVAAPKDDMLLFAMLESARAVVRQLESALEAARKHEQEILRRLGN